MKDLSSYRHLHLVSITGTLDNPPSLRSYIRWQLHYRYPILSQRIVFIQRPISLIHKRQLFGLDNIWITVSWTVCICHILYMNICIVIQYIWIYEYMYCRIFIFLWIFRVHLESIGYLNQCLLMKKPPFWSKPHWTDVKTPL